MSENNLRKRHNIIIKKSVKNKKNKKNGKKHSK